MKTSIYLFILSIFFYTTVPAFSSQSDEERSISQVLNIKDLAFEILEETDFQDITSLACTSQSNNSLCQEYAISVAQKHKLPNFKNYTAGSLKPYFCLFNGLAEYNVKIDWLVFFMHESDLKTDNKSLTREAHITLRNKKFKFSYTAFSIDDTDGGSVDPDLYKNQLSQLHSNAFIKFQKTSIEMYNANLHMTKDSKFYEDLGSKDHFDFIKKNHTRQIFGFEIIR